MTLERDLGSGPSELQNPRDGEYAESGPDCRVGVAAVGKREDYCRDDGEDE